MGDLMLRTKALRKIFITTLSLFILLTVFTIIDNNTITSNILKTDLEIEDNVKANTNNIYVFNKDFRIVKTKIFLDDSNLKDKVIKLLDNLIIGQGNNLPEGLYGTIPKNTKIIDVLLGNNIVTVNFSKELLNVSQDNSKNVVASIVYSIIDLCKVDDVNILVEDKVLKYYPNLNEKLPDVLNKNIGINEFYNLTSRDNINKVVIYYLEDINDKLYYVPVTKYLNDDRDKIKIIVEELSSKYIYESNLMSFLNSNALLLNYKEEDNVMNLYFNDYLFDSNDKVLEEVLYSLAYSVFDNYDVDMVSFDVSGKIISCINRYDELK